MKHCSIFMAFNKHFKNTAKKVGIFSRHSIPSFHRSCSPHLNPLSVFLFPKPHFEG